jgi:AcrR family transcriptional regulator
MNDALAATSAPRLPLQARARARFDVVLETAHALLAENGHDGFSIQAIAERSGFTRASIYNFFPTPIAILTALAARELQALEDALLTGARYGALADWQQQLRETVNLAVRFYRQRPVAQLLILGGPLTDENYRAQALTIRHLGHLSQRLLRHAGVVLPEHPVDVNVLAVELGTACMRHSVLLHGRITEAMRVETADVMIRYLAPYVHAFASDSGG